MALEFMMFTCLNGIHQKIIIYIINKVTHNFSVVVGPRFPIIMQCNAMQCSAVQCSAVQCSAVQCSAVQCNAMQCNAMQCNAMQCNAMQCNAL